MRKFNFLFGLLLVAFLCTVCDVQARNRKKEVVTEQTTGAQDRAQWVKWLWKISYPVIHNLAEGTLHKNMPIETASGETKGYDEMTHLEAVGRTLAGVAPWLALPDDDTEEGKLRKQMREEVLKGLKNAVDPNSPDKLNFTKHAQPIVDAAYLVHAFLRAPEALWKPLDEVTKQRYIDSFKALRDRTGAYNNWLLFTGLTESFLLQQGEKADQFRLRVSKNKIQEWYVGDGWYADGPVFAFDYYSSYVFHPMYLETLQAMVDAKANTRLDYKKYYQRELKRAQKFSIILERFISPEGTYPVIGRSTPYRLAAMQPLALMAWYEKLPSDLSNGQVRAALTKVMHRMFDHQNNYNEGGFLTIGFCGSQKNIADWYTNNGSLYMTSLAFMPLGLPATSPFWTDEAKPWTQVKAWNGQDFPKDHRWADDIQTKDKW